MGTRRGGIVSDDRLRELYTAALAGRSAGRGHPAPEALAALARREGSEADRLATLDHVMTCTDCRRDFDLLRTVERAGAEAGAASRAADRRSWLMPAALAASLLVALGLGRQLLLQSYDTTRGGATGALVLVQPAAAMPAGQPVTFTWQPVAGANRYELELLDSTGAVAASAATADTSASPPALRALPPGEYRWWVSALLVDSRTIRSPLRTLRLTAR
jgi:hypothetical protein